MPRKATAPEPEVVNPDPSEVASPDEGQVTEVDVTPVAVVMKLSITGTRDGEPWPPIGGTVELPADEADRFVRLGYAELPD